MPRSKEVDAWFARYENPMKDVVERIREIVLAADKRIGECIKWQAPTFTFEGNLASFFPKAKQHASLMFHQGAKIPGKHPLLQGAGGTSRMLKLGSVAEANAAKPDLIKIVKAWCDWKAGAASTQKAPAKKQGAAGKQAASGKARAPAASKAKPSAKQNTATKATPKKPSGTTKKAPVKKAAKRAASAKKSAPKKATAGKRAAK